MTVYIRTCSSMPRSFTLASPKSSELSEVSELGILVRGYLEMSRDRIPPKSHPTYVLVTGANRYQGLWRQTLVPD